tara:strand:- start:2624 stop:3271 length:648 start_codon:yes stop_codon:yes gene_type:complete
MQNLNFSKKIVIIDYKMSNLFSVVRACQKVGFNPIITNKAKVIKNADAIILPGVGAFNSAMKNLINLELVEPIISHVRSGKPIMGVCLGMQLLFEKSEEFGNHFGLGLIKGEVVKFLKTSNLYKVPQIGWNSIKLVNNEGNIGFFKGISKTNHMYFVHSFYVIPANKKVIYSTSKYNDIEYCSSILKDNIFATQFHPEKSGELGLLIYKNWFNKI